MWWKSAQRASRTAALLAAALLAACGGGKTPDGKLRPSDPPFGRDLDPADILPADLDLVVRIDLARMRAGVGPLAAESFEAEAQERAGEDVLRGAIACADVIWLGARTFDLDAGDHVVVVEGNGCAPDLDLARWERVPSANKRVAIFDRAGSEAPRSGTARVVKLGTRATAFVSPVERDSVSRVLRDGPDKGRGSPTAEGVISLDMRTGRLPPALERKFPSISALLGGLERVRGTAAVIAEGVKVEAEIASPTEKGAAKALRFLEVLRDNVADPRLRLLMGGVRIEQVGNTVRVRMVVPASVVLGLVAKGGGGGEATPGGESREAR